MNSLRARFTIAAVVISIISFGLAAFFSVQWITEEIAEDYKEKAALMGTHIVHDLGAAMLARIHGGIPEVLNLYRGYKGVEEIRVFNVKGEEKFFQEKGPSEPRIEEAFKKGQPVHFLKEINKREVSSFVFPMKNNSSCQQCHGKSEPFTGAILLSLSQEHLERYLSAFKQRFYILFAFLALAICVATIITFDRLFLKPLGAIEKGAEEIGKGRFHHQIPVTSKDEIGHLASAFNDMAQALLIQNRELTEQCNLVSRSQKEWQETFDCITDAIAVVDRDCHLLKTNRAFRDLFGEHFYPPGDPINKKCSDLFGICLFSRCPNQVTLQERRPVNTEIHGHNSGKLFEISLFPFESPEGEFVGSVAVLKNITEKKENELRTIMKERLATLGQMASGIAHEINNPLATISIAAEGILKRVREGRFDPRLFDNYLAMIKDEVQRVMNITKDMLSFVRKKTEGKRPVLINQLLDNTLEMAQFQGRFQEVAVLRLYQEEMPAVPAYEGELRQIFLSLLTNASDAMEDKGQLTLETGTEDKILFVKISDTGPGIPSGVRERIFDPFFTTKSEKGGTGLGLSIADKIIRENNGKIEVASEEGRGTTFKITLPLESP